MGECAVDINETAPKGVVCKMVYKKNANESIDILEILFKHNY